MYKREGTQRHVGLRMNGAVCYSAIAHEYAQEHYTELHRLPQYHTAWIHLHRPTL